MQPKPFVAAAALGAVGVLVLAAAMSLLAPGQAVGMVPLHDAQATGGSQPPPGEVRLSALDGGAPTWLVASATPDLIVIVLKVPTAQLEAAAAATGQPTGRWAVEHPGEPGMSLLGYDARSTHLGCTVQLVPGLATQVAPVAAVPVVRLMDPCHHGQWNALAMAQERPGTFAPRPLGVVPLALGPGDDPVLLAGPAIEQHRPFDAARVERAPPGWPGRSH